MKTFLFVLAIVALMGISQAMKYPLLKRMGNRTPQMYRQRVPQSSRIVGGQDANIADHPHMLALLDLRFGGFICGASAIHEFWALSAAHCLEFNSPASDINLRGGSSNRLTGGYLFFAQNYTLHPQYDDFWLVNDVALIRLQNDSPLRGVNVVPIPISPRCSSACCDVCYSDNNGDVAIKGWGRNTAGQIPTILQEIFLPLYNHAACDTVWGGIADDAFCVGSGDGRDSCDGDSGGPLTRVFSGIRRQVGAVSFGSINCGDGSAPNVNARLEYPPIRDWITSQTGF